MHGDWVSPLGENPLRKRRQGRSPGRKNLEKLREKGKMHRRQEQTKFFLEGMEKFSFHTKRMQQLTGFGI